MFENILNFLKQLFVTLIGAAFGLTFMVMIIYGFFYLIGEMYIGGRLAFIGKEKTVVVDSIWFNLEKIYDEKPRVNIKHFRFKDFDGNISGLPATIKLGDSVRIKYYSKLKKGMVIKHDTTFLQVVDGLGGFIVALAIIALVTFFFFIPFLFHCSESFNYVLEQTAKKYIKKATPLDKFGLIHKSTHYFIQLLPSILSIFLNGMLLLVFLKMLLYVENLNQPLCGLVVFGSLSYFSFLGPKWFKWLYQIRFSNHWFLDYLRVAVETVIGLKLILELVQLFTKREFYFDNLFALINKVIQGIWDYLFN